MDMLKSATFQIAAGRPIHLAHVIRTRGPPEPPSNKFETFARPITVPLFAHVRYVSLCLADRPNLPRNECSLRPANEIHEAAFEFHTWISVSLASSYCKPMLKQRRKGASAIWQPTRDMHTSGGSSRRMLQRRKTCSRMDPHSPLCFLLVHGGLEEQLDRDVPARGKDGLQIGKSGHGVSDW